MRFIVSALCLSVLLHVAPSLASAQDATPATAFGSVSLSSPRASGAEARGRRTTPASAFGPSEGTGLSISLAEGDPSFAAELEYADGESHAAATLYASSFIMLGVGAVTGVSGTFAFFVGVFGGDGPFVGAGIGLWGVGAAALLGHIVTLALAISYDVGSGVRHGRLEDRQAGLAFRLTSGPGDVGLGAGLVF